MRSFYSFVVLFLLNHLVASAQVIIVVTDQKTKDPVSHASFRIDRKKAGNADRYGRIDLVIDSDSTPVFISATGYRNDTIYASPADTVILVELDLSEDVLGEVVVTGTMRTVLRSSSPVPVELYTPAFFMKNPTPNLFDALQMINGVRPQLNCNVCNTGDIHINGLEGPYTMILIDGMPIVSSLASVYGLSGIPNSMIERVELVKGPASSLYGSEAIGGLINVITKNPARAPLFSADISNTSWNEISADLGMKFRTGKKSSALLGINYYYANSPRDLNHDHFTDLTLQHRISLFNKISWERKKSRQANLAIRYNYEDRWGGDMRWNKSFRGGDSLYGESIYTSRIELIGNYQLPTSSKWTLSYSFNDHMQRSAYGTMLFNAVQRTGFAQLIHEKEIGAHNLLGGMVGRLNYYDDNTVATLDTLHRRNKPDQVFLPGIFIQDEMELNIRHLLLLGLRNDYDRRHGNIFTPRVAYKYSFPNSDLLRINAGTGFRVVNLFTEDHAALTGAREVVVRNRLKPEKSYNLNLNYLKKIQTEKGWVHLDLSAWYTHFTNRILPDYLSNPNQIIYDNLKGYSISKGISANAEMGFTSSLRLTIGGTLMDVNLHSRNETGKSVRSRQLLTENWTGTWTISYSFRKPGLVLDYTGNIYGPMLLPVLSDLDPRAKISPVWSIQNLQLTKKWNSRFQVYGGVKNLLNWTPAKNAPFLIARSFDPFDKQVQFDAGGQPVSTPGNPYALSFDPNYVYAPNQGIRIFAGIRYNVERSH